MDDNPQELRARSTSLDALAQQIRDDAPAHADLLVEESKELQDRAKAIEEAASAPPAPEAPRQPAKFQEQAQLKEDGR